MADDDDQAPVADTEPPTTTAKPEPAKEPPRQQRQLPAAVAGGLQTGAGFLLGLLVWGWVAMPLIEGGPAQVKKVIRAKFLNQTPDGKWLP